MKPYLIGLYEKAMPKSLSWEEKLICAKDCGYDYVEMSIDETDDKLARLEWGMDERANLTALMRDTGMPIRSICLSGHRRYPMGSADPDIRKRSMDIMEKAVILADDLGIRTIQLAGYDVYYEESTEESRRWFGENLERAACMAAVHGILLGFETMETEFMDTCRKSMAWVDKINSPYLGVYPDAGNLTNASVIYGADVCDDLRLAAGRIIALHLKETVPGRYREVPFLTGHVNFSAVIDTAWDMGVRRYVTEMWDVGRESWKEDIMFACGSMRALLDETAKKYKF